jgi:hypothetical protein
MYNVFQQIVNKKPNLEIERSNVTHKHFINALTEAFDALGSNAQGSNKTPSAVEDADKALVFCN